jgi:hypothetical protein
MSRTKEEIIRQMKEEMPFRLSHQFIPYILEAMQIYADQEAKAFAKWLRDNTVADGSPKLVRRLDMKRYTMEELYDIYKSIKPN